MEMRILVSCPLVHYGLEIVLDRAPFQEIVSKLIAIAAETPEGGQALHFQCLP